MPEDLPRDGLVAVVKRDCPTCVLAAPVLGDLARDAGLTVYTQDDPSFPETVPARVDDTALDISHRLKIEIVPTLIRFEAGHEVDRTYGWDRGEWLRSRSPSRFRATLGLRNHAGAGGNGATQGGQYEIVRERGRPETAASDGADRTGCRLSLQTLAPPAEQPQSRKACAE